MRKPKRERTIGRVRTGESRRAEMGRNKSRLGRRKEEVEVDRGRNNHRVREREGRELRN